MKLQKMIYTGLGALAITVAPMTSCTDEVAVGNSFIEKAPGNTQTLDTVFSNAEYTKQFLTGIYALQYYGLPFNQSAAANSDKSYTGKLDGLTDLYQIHWSSVDIYNNFYGGALNATSTPPISFSGDQVWEVIRSCNILLQNIDKVPNLSDDDKRMMIAQAKCIKAARYFDLYSVYGGLPNVGDVPFTGNEAVFNYPRQTAEETCNFIVALLDDAINAKLSDGTTYALVWKYHDGTDVSTDMDATNNTGRWTRGGAMALKAKVLLFNASPLYNSNDPWYNGNTEAEKNHLVWHGNYDVQRWQRAREACKEFFVANGENGDLPSSSATDVNSTVNDATYHLNGTKGADWEIKTSGQVKTSDAEKINYYRQAYRMGYIYQGSAEILHSTRVATIYGSQGSFSWWTWANPLGSVRRNSYPPTEEYVEMFPWSNGKPFNWEADSLAGNIGHFTADGSTTETVGKLFYEFKKAKKGSAWNKVGSRDPRLYENAFVCSQPTTLAWNTGKASGDILELWLGGSHAGNDILKLNSNKEPEVAENLTTGFPTGYGNIKYVLGEEYHRKFLQWVYLSYDEMLLMYAECLAHTESDMSKAQALVDRVRNRVGLGKLSTYASDYKAYGMDLSTEEGMTELILQERACELGMSNNRYYDMVRYKRLDWMTKQLHGLGIFRTKADSKNVYQRNYNTYAGTDKDNGDQEPNRFEYMRFSLKNRKRVLWDYGKSNPSNPYGYDPNFPDDYSQYDLYVKKWLLFPLPQTETLKNYGGDGLTQNPGW